MANDNHDSRDQKGNGKIILVDFYESPEALSASATEVVSENNTLFRLQPVVAPFIGNIFHPPIA